MYFFEISYLIYTESKWDIDQNELKYLCVVDPNEIIEIELYVKYVGMWCAIKWIFCSYLN